MIQTNQNKYMKEKKIRTELDRTELMGGKAKLQRMFYDISNLRKQN